MYLSFILHSDPNTNLYQLVLFCFMTTTATQSTKELSDSGTKIITTLAEMCLMDF